MGHWGLVIGASDKTCRESPSVAFRGLDTHGIPARRERHVPYNGIVIDTHDSLLTIIVSNHPVSDHENDETPLAAGAWGKYND